MIYYSNINYILLFFLYLSLFFTNVREASDAGIGLIQLIRAGILLLCLLIIFFYSAPRRKFDYLFFIKKSYLKFYFYYIVVAFLSTFYSGYKIMTLGKSFEIFVDLIVISFIFSNVKDMYNLKKIWNYNIIILILIILYTFIISLLFKKNIFEIGEFGIPIWRGFGHPNSLTHIGAILAIVSTVRLLEIKNKRINLSNKYKYKLLFLFGIAIIIVTRSRTSIFIFIFLLMLTHYLYKRYSFKNFILVLTILFFLTFNFDFIVNFILRNQTVEQFKTLSGRLTGSWIAGINLFLDSPFWGNGFYYTTRILASNFLAGNLYTQLSNLDNTYLEILANVGIIGFLPIFFLVLKIMKVNINILKEKIRKPYISNETIEVSLITISTLIRSLVNPTFQYHHWNTILFLSMISYLYLYNRKKLMVKI